MTIPNGNGRSGWTKGTWIGFLSTVFAAMLMAAGIHEKFIEPSVLRKALKETKVMVDTKVSKEVYASDLSYVKESLKEIKILLREK